MLSTANSTSHRVSATINHGPSRKGRLTPLLVTKTPSINRLAADHQLVVVQCLRVRSLLDIIGDGDGKQETECVG